MALLLNPKFLICTIVAVVLALGGFFLYRAGKAAVRVDFEAYKVGQAEARILSDRAREHSYAARQAATNEEALHGQKLIASLQTDLVDTRAAGERLRAAIRDAAAARGGENSGASAPGQGKPDSDPIGLFAILLNRADARAERVGEYADRLAIAGGTCERYADRLQPAGGKAP